MSEPTDASPLPRLPARQPDSHKGDFGHVLLIGGSRPMAGAVALAGQAALRSGAGLVTLATADACQPTVASFEPSLMTLPLASDDAGRIGGAARVALETAARQATVVACGPGLGRSPELTALVGWLYREWPQPMVFDADALNALSEQREILSHHAGPRILTPHPGEFARLTGREKVQPQDRESNAREFAAQHKVVLLLKGHRTIVTDGSQFSLNSTGNPGMASGGTGDVLTGVIAAIVAQHLAPYEAARLGAFIHGLAGDLAAAELGQVSLIASDLVAHLSRAWRQAS